MSIIDKPIVKTLMLKGEKGEKGEKGDPSGSPLVASSTSEMTDTTTVYVNTTDGYWYYYDGTDWQPGGVYQSTALPSATQDIIDNALTYRGNIISLGYTSFGSCTLNGYYNFGTSQVASITDKPSDLTSAGILIVYRMGGGNARYQFIYDGNGKKWFRVGTTGSFLLYSGDTRDNLIYRGNVISLGYTAFSSCTDDGYYTFTSGNLASITDKPTGLTKGGKLIVLHKDYNYQYLINNDGDIWYRNNSSGSYASFKKLNNSYNGNVIDLGYTTFAECTGTGYYSFTTANVSSIEDKPSELTTAGNLYVFEKSGGGVRFYYLSDVEGHIWFKYTGTSSTWKLLNPEETTPSPYINWCCMGDSISQGWYSYMEGNTPTSATDSTKAWTTKVAALNNWNLTNISQGGTGYLHVRDAQTHPNDKNGYTLSSETDYSSYNLVTLCYGINDWKGNRPIGTVNDSSSNPTTVCGAMKGTIENIMNSNPNCKIIVVLPLNAWGYAFSYGDKSTNYGLGYTFSNSGTLETFVQKMIEVCNYYGIEYIDQTHYSVVNRENLPSLLIDGVHPSETAHTLLSHELSKKISA